MLGVRTVALFKNTHPLKWAPLGPNVTVIADVKPPEVIHERIKERLDGYKTFALTDLRGLSILF
jgi:hypothetical protein